MAETAWRHILQFGFLTYFIVFSYISVTSSVSLDLTELRNRVSKIKVNPRGNLWATGHFMGKKNAVDSSSLESPNKLALNAIRVALMPEQKAQDWREFIVEQMIKVAVQDHLQEPGEKIDNNEPVSELIYRPTIEMLWYNSV
uniref:Neuromedin B n=1 Tax=Paramormyrops kingsleyae TaxID=1676925 RepID=A0A3B3S677_9TELE